jgi:hypothetical protein
MPNPGPNGHPTRSALSLVIAKGHPLARRKIPTFRHNLLRRLLTITVKLLFLKRLQTQPEQVLTDMPLLVRVTGADYALKYRFRIRGGEKQ